MLPAWRCGAPLHTRRARGRGARAARAGGRGLHERRRQSFRRHRKRPGLRGARRRGPDGGVGARSADARLFRARPRRDPQHLGLSRRGELPLRRVGALRAFERRHAVWLLRAVRAGARHERWIWLRHARSRDGARVHGRELPRRARVARRGAGVTLRTAVVSCRARRGCRSPCRRRADDLWAPRGRPVALAWARRRAHPRGDRGARVRATGTCGEA